MGSKNHHHPHHKNHGELHRGLPRGHVLNIADRKRTQGDWLISRRHLEKILGKPILACNKIVNDRARSHRVATIAVKAIEVAVGGNDMNGSVFFIDGNTPITIDIEEGVRCASRKTLCHAKRMMFRVAAPHGLEP